MADYPSKIPVLPIVGPNQYPRSEDINRANREVEAICAEVGVAPKTITDVAAAASPASFAVLLDMLSNLAKTFTGATNWYSAAVPMRRIVGGNGGNGTVGAGGTSYVGMGSFLTSATENLTQMIVPFHCTAVSLYAVTASSQPGTGSLVFTLRKNNVDTAITATRAAGAAAGTSSGTGSIEFYPGDILSVKVVNNAAGASATIATVTLELDQQG